MNVNEHLLTTLAEECCEVAQRVTKALRFGLSEVQSDQPLNNAERIQVEMADLVATYDLLIRQGVLKFPSADQIAAKKEKVEKFLQYSRTIGTLKIISGMKPGKQKQRKTKMIDGVSEGSSMTTGDQEPEKPAKAKRAGGGKKKKPEPQELPNISGPGVGLVKLPAITAAARRYEKIKNERVELTRQEVDSKRKLSELIHANEDKIGKDGDGVIRYRYDEKVVIVEPKGESLKIRDADEPEIDED